jgi:hypothetical protein
MHLFTTGKIPMYCEGITHRLEKRKDSEVKVVDLTLRVFPFTGQLASALDQDEYGFVKRTLFNLNSGDPSVDLRAVEFKPPSERQRMHCFASPDSDVASILLDQVKVTKLRARGSKDANGWALILVVSFGPLDKTELAFVNEFYTKQQFIRWEAAEPSLAFEDTDAGESPDPDGGGRPTPMWDESDVVGTVVDAMEQVAVTDEEKDVVRTIKSRGSKPRKKVDHDAERKQQRAEGVKQAKAAKTRKTNGSGDVVPTTTH